MVGELEVGAPNRGIIPDLFNDEDLFRFYLEPGLFTADVINFDPGPGAASNPAITLFENVNGSMYARAASDPNIYEIDLSYNVLSSGWFYLMVNQFGNDPQSGALDFYDPANYGLIWNKMSGVPFFGSSWGYSITVAGIDSAFMGTVEHPYLVPVPQYVPVPSAVWLFSSGLIGLIGIARRRV